MDTKTKKRYEEPKLTVVTFVMERGYADSVTRLGLAPSKGNKSLEGREEGGNWGGSDGWF